MFQLQQTKYEKTVGVSPPSDLAIKMSRSWANAVKAGRKTDMDKSDKVSKPNLQLNRKLKRTVSCHIETFGDKAITHEKVMMALVESGFRKGTEMIQISSNRIEIMMADPKSKSELLTKGFTYDKNHIDVRDVSIRTLAVTIVGMPTEIATHEILGHMEQYGTKLLTLWLNLLTFLEMNLHI